MMSSLLTSLKERLVSVDTNKRTFSAYKLCKPKNNLGAEDSVEKLSVDNNFNIEKFLSLEEFSNELESYSSHNKTKIKSKSRKRKHEDRQIVCEPSICYISDVCVCSILQKAFDNSKFWSVNGLKHLVRSKFVSSTCQKVMVDCIVKYKSFDVFEVIAESNLPMNEELIVRVLKHAIRELGEKCFAELSNQLIIDHCPLDVKTAKNILYVISVPYNEISMKEYLKLLTTNEALILLQLLHYVLHIVSPALISNSESDIDIPKTINEKKVLYWIDSVLSSHMIGFLSSSMLKELITQLQTTTVRQKRFYRDIVLLAPYLDCLQTKKMNLPQRTIGNYAIETITL